jgi:hypothetical protein
LKTRRKIEIDIIEIIAVEHLFNCDTTLLETYLYSWDIWKYSVLQIQRSSGIGGETVNFLPFLTGLPALCPNARTVNIEKTNCGNDRIIGN